MFGHLGLCQRHTVVSVRRHVVYVKVGIPDSVRTSLLRRGRRSIALLRRRWLQGVHSDGRRRIRQSCNDRPSHGYESHLWRRPFRAARETPQPKKRPRLTSRSSPGPYSGGPLRASDHHVLSPGSPGFITSCGGFIAGRSRVPSGWFRAERKTAQPKKRPRLASRSSPGPYSGARTRTCDLRVMSTQPR